MNPSTVQGGVRKKLLRTCDACRTSKIRCIVDEKSDDVCERCLRLGKPCTFSEARGRSKQKNPKSNTKIADVEKRINDIYSMLQNGTAQSAPGAGGADSPQSSQQQLSVGNNPASSMESGGVGCNPAAALSGQMPVPAFPLTPSSSATDGGVVEASAGSDVIARGFISYRDAESAWASFVRDFAAPLWICPPSQMDMATVRRERPFLLLAALSLAYQENLEVQILLEQETRKVLAQRVIIEGTKDLDLLLGLTASSLWYHVHPDPKVTQMYTFAQLCITLATDLNLAGTAIAASDLGEKLEKSRLYLTIYLLSTSNSVTMRKPISMTYNDGVKACCRILSEAKQAPSDAYLVGLVQVQRIQEDIANTFQYDSLGEQHPDIESAERWVQVYEGRIDDLETSNLNNSLDMALRHARVYLYEIALHLPPRRPVAGGGRSLDNGGDAYAAKHTNLLLGLLNRTRAFHDAYVVATRDEVLRHNNVDKAWCAHAAMVLLKLSFSTAYNTPENPYPLRKACNMSGYLGLLSRDCRFHEGCTGENCMNRNALWYFRDRIRRVKQWYEHVEMFNEGAEQDVESLSPLRLHEISKTEPLSMDFDFGLANLMEFDFSSWQ